MAFGAFIMNLVKKKLMAKVAAKGLSKGMSSDKLSNGTEKLGSKEPPKLKKKKKTQIELFTEAMRNKAIHNMLK